MKKYIITIFAFASFLSVTHATNSENRQSAISPIDSSCKTFLNASYVPDGWRHISSCDGSKTTKSLTKRTIKKLPNYEAFSRYKKTKQTTNIPNEVKAKPALINLRPRKTADIKKSAKKINTRRSLPDYNSTFSKRFQLTTNTNQANSTQKSLSRNRQRTYSGISAASAIKKQSSGVLTANTWTKTINNRIKNLDKTNVSQFWRSRNSLIAEKRSTLKTPDRAVRAKLKRRYVGAPRIGSLDNVSLED